jgi:predicted TIM-barrel fold metal-dependent hydrolase
MCVGEAQVSLVIKAVKAHPDRLAAFMGLDPRRPGATKLLERAVNDWGMKGLKLHPPAYEFYPNDNMVYPLYQKALELGIPVAIHTGAETPPRRSKFAQPVFVDDVAIDFPGLTLILAHAGLMWWWDAISLAAFKPNVYLELAGWQPRLRRNPMEFYTALRTMIDLVGPGRVMLGSDWPALKFAVSQERWVRAFKEVPDFVQAAGIKFTENEMKGVLGDTAAKLLRL